MPLLELEEQVGLPFEELPPSSIRNLLQAINQQENDASDGSRT